MTYAEKLEARKQRLLDKSEKAYKEAMQNHDDANNISKMFVNGQPILVGHHSEKRHRSLINKMHTKLDKTSELFNKSDELERKANAVGKGGISSYDEDAKTKLQNRIDALVKIDDDSKKLNKTWKELLKKHLKSSGLDKIDKNSPLNEDIKNAILLALADFKAIDEVLGGEFEEEIKRQSRYISWAYIVPVGSYNTAEIKRLRDRLAQLEKFESAGDVIIKGDGITYTRSPECMQVRFEFDSFDISKPFIDELKSNAFKWSRTQNAWVRKLTNNAVYSARNILAILKESGFNLEKV